MLVPTRRDNPNGEGGHFVIVMQYIQCIAEKALVHKIARMLNWHSVTMIQSKHSFVAFRAL